MLIGSKEKSIMKLSREASQERKVRSNSDATTYPIGGYSHSIHKSRTQYTDTTMNNDNYDSSTTDNLTEDDNLRVMVEMFRPHIYRDVKYILLEEQSVRKALRKNKTLSFPCKCYHLCEFSYLIQPMTNALDELYKEYALLHDDYHKLFYADTISTDGNIIYINNNNNNNNNSHHPVQVVKQNEFNTQYVLSLVKFYYDIEHLNEKLNAQNNEWIFRKTLEPYLEIIRLYINKKMTTLKWERIKLWFMNHLIAKKKCICLHCDYRDILIDYRDALINLHKEYIILYANYYVLINSTNLNEKDINNKNIRTVRINSKNLQYIKLFFTVL
ncbi:unnamed protein product [Heterobilharzia americana]|nr:unnamed protein product [Heterobilharzia americana]